MIVTAVEPLGKTKEKIFLEGEFAFVLYKGEVKRFGIEAGEELTEETVHKIFLEVLLKRAKLRAMHLLEGMDRTEAGLREKLRQGLYPPEIVDAAVEYVRSFGYLDDHRYAENFVRSRMGTKSRREITFLLRQKGIPEDMIESAFDSCGEEDGEEEAIRRILRKKRVDLSGLDDAQKQKIYGYLARKGFQYQAIRQVIQNNNDSA